MGQGLGMCLWGCLWVLLTLLALVAESEEGVQGALGRTLRAWNLPCTGGVPERHRQAGGELDHEEPLTCRVAQLQGCLRLRVFVHQPQRGVWHAGTARPLNLYVPLPGPVQAWLPVSLFPSISPTRTSVGLAFLLFQSSPLFCCVPSPRSTKCCFFQRGGRN